MICKAMCASFPSMRILSSAAPPNTCVSPLPTQSFPPSLHPVQVGPCAETLRRRPLPARPRVPWLSSPQGRVVPAVPWVQRSDGYENPKEYGQSKGF